MTEYHGCVRRNIARVRRDCFRVRRKIVRVGWKNVGFAVSTCELFLSARSLRQESTDGTTAQKPAAAGSSSTIANAAHVRQYSRSPKNPALQQLQKSSKSASTTPQRPIWNYLVTVGVRDFSENGCTSSLLSRGVPEKPRTHTRQNHQTELTTNTSDVPEDVERGEAPGWGPTKLSNAVSHFGSSRSSVRGGTWRDPRRRVGEAGERIESDDTHAARDEQGCARQRSKGIGKQQRHEHIVC